MEGKETFVYRHLVCMCWRHTMLHLPMRSCWTCLLKTLTNIDEPTSTLYTRNVHIRLAKLIWGLIINLGTPISVGCRPQFRPFQQMEDKDWKSSMMKLLEPLLQNELFGLHSSSLWSIKIPRKDTGKMERQILAYDLALQSPFHWMAEAPQFFRIYKNCP